MEYTKEVIIAKIWTNNTEINSMILKGLIVKNDLFQDDMVNSTIVLSSGKGYLIVRINANLPVQRLNMNDKRFTFKFVVSLNDTFFQKRML